MELWGQRLCGRVGFEARPACPESMLLVTQDTRDEGCPRSQIQGFCPILPHVRHTELTRQPLLQSRPGWGFL